MHRARAEVVLPSTHQLINASTSILAFGFVSPWLLWGLALGGVPILIQWLHRRHYTHRVWAAMRFLNAATRSQSRRLRFESLLLLLLRTLIILLVAFALAEPFLESAGWLPPSQRSVHRLIVLDTSLSMQFDAADGLVSDRAREAARRIVTDARPGDSFQVVTVGEEARALVSQPAYETSEILGELEQLAWTEEFGDVPGALRLAQQLLGQSPQTARREVLLVSDFQRSNWWPESPAARQQIQRMLTELTDAAELVLIHVQESLADNSAVTDLTIDPLPVTIGESVDVVAQVTRSGSNAADPIQVELLEGDRVLQTRSLDVPPDGEAPVVFTHRWQDAGWHGLQVRLQEDGLDPDNRRWVSVEVREELNVLLVNGRESGESLGRATDFVELALQPGLASDGSARGVVYQPTVVNEAEFARTELAKFQCVVLCDVPFLSEAEQARLRTFVHGGGGLVIGSGNQLQLAAYNQWFDESDDSLMPISLVEIAEADDVTESPFRFAAPERSVSPIVEPFVGNPQAGLTTANIYRYLPPAPSAPLRAAPAPPPVNGARSPRATRIARVALTYDNGDPAILEHRFGAGRVLFVTTSLDDRWGNWALWPSFLPMIHRLVDYATLGEGLPLRLVGENLRREYAVQTIGLSATLQQPDGRRRPGRSRMVRGATEISFGAVSDSGLYRILLGPPLNRTELVAVNVDPRESDLSFLQENDLQATVLSGIDARLATSAATLTSAASQVPPPSGLTRWILMTVFVLLMVEQLMAWKPRWGLLALAVSPVVLVNFAVWPGLTLVAVLLVLTTLLAVRRLRT